MAKIVGGIGSSHIPAIGVAMDKGLEDTPYWRDFFQSYVPLRKWFNEVDPDILVIFYNDHGLEMFLDKKPTFAVGTAAEYENADEGWGINPIPPVRGETELSWHIVNELVENDFDPTVCQEIKVDHGLTVPLTLMYPAKDYSKVKVIPICINCERHPMPKLSRSYAFGQQIGRAIESFGGDQKVVVMGTGGLSHQLDGERAGIINTEFDLLCMEKIVSDPEYLTKYSLEDIVELAGGQGVELNMWMAMRGCLTGKVTEGYSNLVAPISNTAAGIQLLINE
ncbi:class III extradiol dioxygenase family protein [Amphritea pacifica]|uniref:Protocatechuate 3,4-dioxygenase n=1 Tax=Amphritea pacifica TaxID=2811233 RepID=A0ABS2WBY8_9GAMM|nr:class III extradiol dioxygenase family protein [Amphritea pacifica]MBN0989098.1 protocatechuate 3,4-dioxygenase [Amphritea pacifica]MBN1008582.1 protocatechuate 3,4-dioxygenase [Amphritea pacifica]